MSIYRRKLRSGKRSSLYTAEFEHHGAKHIRGGFPDRESAKLWLNTEQLKLRRGAVGYVKPMLAAQVTPLIEQYVTHLRERDRDSHYAYVSGQRLKKLAGECGWITLGHVTRESLQSWLATGTTWKGRICKPQTLNQYADHAYEWGKWLSSPKVGKLPANPMVGIERLPEKVNSEYRRAATAAELNAILAKCPADRHLFYLFRIYQSSIRQRTMKRLTYRMAHLDATPPYLLIPGEDDKGRKDKKYVLRFSVAQDLRALRKKTKAKVDDLVFPNPPTLEDFRADMKDAGVKPEFGKDRGRIDYHALRSAFVQLGKDEGLTAFQMMDLMGWKSMQTMMKHYSKNSVDASLGVSMERLPVLGSVRKAE